MKFVTCLYHYYTQREIVAEGGEGETWGGTEGRGTGSWKDGESL